MERTKNKIEIEEYFLKNLFPENELENVISIMQQLKTNGDEMFNFTRVENICELNEKLNTKQINFKGEKWHYQGRSTNYINFHSIPVEKLNNPEIVIIYCLGTFHWIGYNREKYLKLLENENQYFVFPFFLIRLTDWVKPIVRLVSKYIHENIEIISTDFLIENPKLMEYLNKRINPENKEAIKLLNNKIIDYYKDEPNFSTIINFEPRKKREYAYYLTKNYKLSISQMQKLLNDKDPMIRCSVLNQEIDINLENFIINSLLNDKSSLVRLRLIYKIFINNPNNYIEYIKKYLYDKNKRVNDLAKYCYSKIN